METQIIVTIISSAFILAGTIITVLASNKRNKITAEIKQKILEEDINSMKESIKEHNNYAVEIPLISQRIEFIENEIKEIKEKINHAA